MNILTNFPLGPAGREGHSAYFGDCVHCVRQQATVLYTMDVIWKREEGKRCRRHVGRALHERKDCKRCRRHVGRALNEHKDDKQCREGG